MEGLLGELLKPFAQSGLKPLINVTQKELTITITEDEFKKAIYKGIDERFRRFFDIKIGNGEIKIVVRLQ